MRWDYLEEDLAKTRRGLVGILRLLEPPTGLHENLLVVLQLSEKSLHHAAEALGHAVVGAQRSCQPRVRDQLRTLGMRKSMLVEKEVE